MRKGKKIVALILACVMALGMCTFIVNDTNAKGISANVDEEIVSTGSYWSNFSAPYYSYVDNLSSKQKKLYDDLYSTLYDMIDGGEDCSMNTKGDYLTPEVKCSNLMTDSDIKYVAELMLYEHPELFFIDEDIEIGRSGLNKTVQLEVYEDYSTMVTRVSASSELKNKINYYLNSVNGSSSYDKEKQIHDMLCENVEFSLIPDHKNSIVSALLNEEANSVGYSKAFALLCYASGIPTISVNSASHTWNQVKLGDYWYAVDVMMDDNESIRYDYFNKSDSSIQAYSSEVKQMHTPKTDPWSYVGRPTCSSDYEGENNFLTVYRLYNPNSGEHFYTTDYNERIYTEKAGWSYEGIAWKAPLMGESVTPVYRLYNPYVGDHHYTMSADERDILVQVGWVYEGINWYSDDAMGMPLYRLYNPNAIVGAHHYTVNSSERDYLKTVGWSDEGIAWFGMK